MRTDQKEHYMYMGVTGMMVHWIVSIGQTVSTKEAGLLRTACADWMQLRGNV